MRASFLATRDVFETIGVSRRSTAPSAPPTRAATQATTVTNSSAKRMRSDKKRGLPSAEAAPQRWAPRCRWLVASSRRAPHRATLVQVILAWLERGRPGGGAARAVRAEAPADARFRGSG